VVESLILSNISTRRSIPKSCAQLLFVEVIPNTEKMRHLSLGMRNKIFGAAIALRVFRVDCMKATEGYEGFSDQLRQLDA
jgi:hypothetical protein